MSTRAKSLRVLAFSDYRVQSTPELVDFVAGRKPDLILYGGDDVDRFHESGRNYFEELAALAKHGLCAVAGNDDRNGKEHVHGKRVYAVHHRALALGPFAVVGLEGAPMFPRDAGENMNRGSLLYPDPIVQRQMCRWDQFRDKTMIIVSHAPPFGTLDMAQRFGKRNIGSKPLREYIGGNPRVALCLCGHVHSHGGETENLASCTVINAASHDRLGDSGKIAETVIDRAGQVSNVQWTRL